MLDSELIERIIYRFYIKATNDILIGFHFRNIQDFDQHIPRIARFWAMTLLKEKQQLKESFNLIETHKELKITQGQLKRWIVLFEQNLDEFINQKEIKQKEKLAWMEKVYQIERIFLSHPSLFASK